MTHHNPRVPAVGALQVLFGSEPTPHTEQQAFAVRKILESWAGQNYFDRLATVYSTLERVSDLLANGEEVRRLKFGDRKWIYIHVADTYRYTIAISEDMDRIRVTTVGDLVERKGRNNPPEQEVVVSIKMSADIPSALKKSALKRLRSEVESAGGKMKILKDGGRKNPFIAATKDDGSQVPVGWEDVRIEAYDTTGNTWNWELNEFDSNTGVRRVESEMRERLSAALDAFMESEAEEGDTVKITLGGRTTTHVVREDPLRLEPAWGPSKNPASTGSQCASCGANYMAKFLRPTEDGQVCIRCDCADNDRARERWSRETGHYADDDGRILKAGDL